MRVAQKPLTRTQHSFPITLPSPVGGWNARDALPDMGKDDAVFLTNWFPATTECILRNGYANWATGISGQVETIMSYAGATTDTMFAIANGSVYNTTTQGAVGAAVLSALTNSRWQYCNVATAGGNFLYMANAIDTPYLYNGTTWTSITGVSTPAITGVTTTKLNSPIVFKNRVWFIEAGSLRTWYLPVNSVGGAANAVDISAIAGKGGYIVAHATWTIDAGQGADDYYVMVTNKGQVIVYGGTDPSSASTWALKGVWDLGTPIGNRCLYKYAGDLLMISQDGLVPMSSALQSSRVNPKVALTDKIQWAVSDAVTNYGANYGWDIIYYPKQNQLWLNVPISTGNQQQYVMNTISKAWCNYTGWAANCIEIFKDEPYFGGNGVVCRAWYTNSDNGANIQASGLQAFSHLGSPGVLKRFTMSRPLFRCSGFPTIYAGVNVDFDTADSTAPLTFSPISSGAWDLGLWDSAPWGGNLAIVQNWQGVTGIGYYVAPIVKTASKGIDTRWVSTDIVYERGSIL